MKPPCMSTSIMNRHLFLLLQERCPLAGSLGSVEGSWVNAGEEVQSVSKAKHYIGQIIWVSLWSAEKINSWSPRPIFRSKYMGELKLNMLSPRQTSYRVNQRWDAAQKKAHVCGYPHRTLVVCTSNVVNTIAAVCIWLIIGKVCSWVSWIALCMVSSAIEGAWTPSWGVDTQV